MARDESRAIGLLCPIVMRKHRLWSIGFGFTLVNSSLNLALRFATMPIIGWQPSLLTAEVWLALTFIGALVGVSIMVYATIPVDLSVRFLPTRDFFVRNARVLLLGSFGVFVLAFMTWQSFTIYQLTKSPHLDVDWVARQTQVFQGTEFHRRG